MCPPLVGPEAFKDACSPLIPKEEPTDLQNSKEELTQRGMEVEQYSDPKQETTQKQDAEPEKDRKLKKGRGRPRKHKEIKEFPSATKAKRVKRGLRGEAVESLVVVLKNNEKRAFGDLYEKMTFFKETPNFKETEHGAVVCMLCEMSVGEKRQEHLDKYHPVLETAFKCKICEKISKYKCNITGHIQKLHLKEDQYFECRKCKKAHWDKKQHDEHFAKCQAGHLDPSGICSYCGIYYKKLEAHTKTHLETPKVYQCLQCPDKFKSLSSLHRHIEGVHEDHEKDHVVCQQCGKYFKNRVRLCAHRNKVHPKVLYKCIYDSCNREFKTRDALKNHAMIHSDQKPMSCDYCDFACRQRNSMDVHMNTHHKDKVGTKDRKKHWVKK